MCCIVFEKAKGQCGAVNITSVYAEAAVRSVLYKRCYGKFLRILKKTSVPEYPFWCLLFCETCKNTFFVEQQQMTASDYSSINSSERIIGKQNCKL